MAHSFLWNATRQHARTAIFEYLEGFYNRARRHSTLDYLSPVEFVQGWNERKLKMFRQEHIRVAYQRLRELDWIAR